MSDNTTIQISREVKVRLDQVGHKGDTYNDIIRWLLDREHARKRGK